MSISDKPNTIISIGWLGDKTCYLNVPEEEAIRRWKEANPDEEVHGLETVQVGDEWHSYDGAW